VKLALEDTDTNVRVTAATTLKQLDPDALEKQVVPGLIKSLTNAQQHGNTWEDVLVLGALGNRAKPAVPALVGMLENESLLVRSLVTNAVKGIDPEAAAQAGINVSVTTSNAGGPFSGPFTLTLPKGPSTRIEWAH